MHFFSTNQEQKKNVCIALQAFSRAWNRLHGLPPLAQVTCLPALGTGYKFPALNLATNAHFFLPVLIGSLHCLLRYDWPGENIQKRKYLQGELVA